MAGNPLLVPSLALLGRSAGEGVSLASRAFLGAFSWVSRRGVCLFVVLALVMAPLQARAQECESVLHLKVGKSAPCSGLLWPEGHSTIALSCLKVEIPRLEAQALRLKAEHLAELKALETKLNATTDALAESEKRFEEMVVPVDHWYKSPGLWGVVGVVLGVALTAGAVKLAGELD